MVRSELIEQFVQHMGSVFRGTKHNLQLPPGVPELSHAEIGILFRLSACLSTISASDLADMLGVTGSAATQFIDKLVEKEMIVRERDPSDRRITQITLSPKAEQSIDLIRRYHVRQLQPFFDGLTDQELEQLVQLGLKIKAK